VRGGGQLAALGERMGGAAWWLCSNGSFWRRSLGKSGRLDGRVVADRWACGGGCEAWSGTSRSCVALGLREQLGGRLAAEMVRLGG
jgi:hypothetical protein